VSAETWGRLAVERRIVAMLALLAVIHGAITTLWIILALEPEDLARLVEGPSLASLLAIVLAAIVVNVVDVTLRLPVIRWPRTGPNPRPNPKPWPRAAPLALLGAPSLIVWPFLALRDRRARRRSSPGDQEIEHGFRQLLAIPRAAATSFAICSGLATVAGVSLIARVTSADTRPLALLSVLAAASLAVLVSLATSRLRAMLVPEYLSAPRPDPLALPIHRSLALRLGGPAALALFGAVVTPVLAGVLWIDPSAWVPTLALGLVAGLIALVLLLRDVERDVERASRQVAAVADGEIPEPMAVETFATAELRGLVAAVNRLVGRISDTNVTKYVLIEKGHEADRLKSQFLANMSHDLRSPLNSVLGFSELLTTGIEGELTAKQREIVGTIHRMGKDLLQEIDDILDTAKIEAGHMELHREPTPPATLISRAIQRARVRLDRPIDFDTTFAPGLPPAFIDPFRTTQALENLLLFAAEGLAQGVIEITCEAPQNRKGGRELVIRILSPRALVPLAELEQARRGFFRLPGHTGLGLGLPIATAILEFQNGTLSIEGGSSSSLGGRAAMGFELRLPALTPRRVSRPRARLGIRR
jgi:signal transduction histidine kinase